MAVTVKQEVAALYSAIFNRAPDQAGLEFWVNAINGGESLVQAAEGFTQHPVFAENYAGLTNAQFVEQLYLNVLGGAGDAAGIQFWTDKLASGVSQGQVVAEFVQGSLNIDLDALLASGELSQADYDAAVVRQDSLTNKADVGLHFVEKFGAASNLSADTDTTTKAGLEADPVYLASQAAIAGVTADAASAAAATAAIDAAASPADLNEGEEPGEFTLAQGLDDLASAQSAKSDFLLAYAQDLEVEGEEAAATDVEVAADLNAAVGQVDALVVVGDYTNATAGVRAALLADQQAADALALSKAQADLAKAQQAVANVPGLTQAVANLRAAEDATDVAEDQVELTAAELSGSVARYNSLNGSAVTVDGSNGTVAGLIVENTAKTDLVLATGVTEAKNPGIGALLAATKAKEAADKALASAEKAEEAAESVVNALDVSAAEKTALEAIAVHLELATGVLPTTAQIQSEITRLDALVTTAQAAASQTDVTGTASDLAAANQAVSDFAGLVDAYENAVDDAALVAAYEALVANGTITDPVVITGVDATDAAEIAAAESSIDADNAAEVDALAGVASDAQQAYAAALAADSALATAESNRDDFMSLVSDYGSAATASNSNPLLDDLAAAEDAISTDGKTGIQDRIDALTKAVADLGVAQGNAEQLKVLNDAIKVAQDAFADSDLLVPVSVNGATLATAGSDIYIADDANATISNFGLLGDDALYIGKSFTLNSGALVDGDDSVLEAFFIQAGNDTQVVLETKAYGSTEAGVNEVVITLAGINAAELALSADGIITLA